MVGLLGVSSKSSKPGSGEQFGALTSSGCWTCGVVPPMNSPKPGGGDPAAFGTGGERSPAGVAAALGAATTADVPVPAGWSSGLGGPSTGCRWGGCTGTWVTAAGALSSAAPTAAAPTAWGTAAGCAASSLADAAPWVGWPLAPSGRCMQPASVRVGWTFRRQTMTLGGRSCGGARWRRLRLRRLRCLRCVRPSWRAGLARGGCTRGGPSGRAAHTSWGVLGCVGGAAAAVAPVIAAA